ncbi:MAG: RDD family protein [Clostridia bacterium]|nr:RDD family protein [Clostridia bacterium]
MDLQRAAHSKRLFAFLADLILAGILITAIYFALSTVLDIDRYGIKYEQIKESYEKQYGVEFTMTQEQFDELDDEAKENYRAAVDAMNSDEEANRAIKTSYTLTFVIFAAGIVLAMTLLEFVVPAITKDGRTLGKMLFGLGVMRRNYTRIKNPALFVRGVIGKGVFEIILPIMLILTVTSGITGVFGIVLLAVMLIAEIVVFIKSGSNSLLHDILADTVVIDWASQRIFETEEERDAFVAAQRASADERKLY